MAVPADINYSLQDRGEYGSLSTLLKHSLQSVAGAAQPVETRKHRGFRITGEDGCDIGHWHFGTVPKAHKTDFRC
ncbi:uncharacterized protein PHALS_01645 [Plasmopara halstedii]|uniref:Uncharacterized protein n=1 Tax=Plasmopara halstedii TaxID=4781 RepID=A0A0P1AT08_PLAHL|nr:uncharacterized protein PHALS_01645 [Plasmopara halstedii]CEG45341.1 hypothetical protein PHALS_01645 [Plasmopara halstedii]|eukprot:XP_024581710.1 hypothetical protein PHALS_01645 [Plasmopara halstedii]